MFAVSRSRLPVPIPVFSTVITGMEPKELTKCFKRAAPVGVHSSNGISPVYQGMPLSRISVAGAGTGRMPCAHFTVPLPACTGEARI